MTIAFRVGDEVEYEVDARGLPLWALDVNMSFMRDAPFRIDRALVTEVRVNQVHTRNAHGAWYWPLPGHDTYSPGQWSREGYLRKLKPGFGVCRCDLDRVYYDGHEAECVEGRPSDDMRG